MVENNKCPCECKKHHTCKKIIFGILLHVVVKIYVSIMEDLATNCDVIIEKETKTVKTNFNEKNGICRTKNFYILLAFY